MMPSLRVKPLASSGKWVEVSPPNFLAPSELKRKVTSGRPFWSTSEPAWVK